MSLEVYLSSGGMLELIACLRLRLLDGYAGVVVMRSWIDVLEGVIKGWKAKGDNAAGNRIMEAIVQGVNYRTDTTLLAKDIAPRVQIIGIVKNGACCDLSVLVFIDVVLNLGLYLVALAVYGPGTAETKQSDALWGSKLIAM